MFFILLFFLALDRLLKSFFLENQVGLVKNPGSFPVSSLIILLLVIFIFKVKNKLAKNSLLAMGLIFVGGLSNLIDRVFLGYVIDYLKIPLFPFVFNFSDVLITVGCFLVIYSLPRKAGFN